MALRTETIASGIDAENVSRAGEGRPAATKRPGLLARAVVRPMWRAVIGIAHATGGIEGTNRLLLLAGSGRTATILRRYGARIGENDRILSPLIVHNAEPDYGNLRMESGCHIGRDVLLDLTGPVELERNVTVSMRVTVLTHMDVGTSGLRSIYPHREAGVRIGEGAYLGAGCTVLCGVSIGTHAVVAAGAVVTQDVPAWSVVAGVPARVVKTNLPQSSQGPSGPQAES